MSTNWGQPKVQNVTAKGVPLIRSIAKWGYPKIKVLASKGFPTMQVTSKWGFPCFNVETDPVVTPVDDDEDPLPPEFPGGDIIDNFNRVENPLSTGWAKTVAAWEEFFANGSIALPKGGNNTFNSSHRTGSPKANTDAYYTVVTNSDDIGGFTGIWLRLQPGTTGGSINNLVGYMVAYYWGDILVYKSAPSDGILWGSPESLMGSVAMTLNDGDKLGARISGTNPVTIKAYVDQGAGWVEKLSLDDAAASRIQGKGNNGIYAYRPGGETISFTLDDYGGF